VTSPSDGSLEAPPGVAPVTMLRVQPGTLSEVTNLLGNLRLLLRHLVRDQKRRDAVAAGRSIPGDVSGTGLPTEICFDLLSRTPEEIAADSRQIERLYSSVSALAAMVCGGRSNFRPLRRHRCRLRAPMVPKAERF